MITKSRLAIALSKIKGFNDPKIRLEQYITDSEIAAEILWNAYLEGDIEGKTVADLGCGTGIFSLGCVKLNAKKVYAVESDKDALDIARENVKSRTCTFINSDVKEFDKKVDTVIQNPPYGTKDKHADREFLVKAFQISNKIYSMHKLSTSSFVEKIAEDYEFKIKKVLKFNLPLKKSYQFHKKKTEKIEVGCWVLYKSSSSSCKV